MLAQGFAHSHTDRHETVAPATAPIAYPAPQFQAADTPSIQVPVGAVFLASDLKTIHCFVRDRGAMRVELEFVRPFFQVLFVIRWTRIVQNSMRGKKHAQESTRSSTC